MTKESILDFPLEAINSRPPNVWLKTLYGFSPETWGMLGFTDPQALKHFLSKSRPGALIVVYAAKKPVVSKEIRGTILGIQQVSHEIGSSRQFLHPKSYRDKERDPETKGKWDHAVKLKRAWKVDPSSRVLVEDFAFQTYGPKKGQRIGAWGMPLTAREAKGILNLKLAEVSVYGEQAVGTSRFQPAKLALSPSKPGPVSQKSFWVPEAEGPKFLYVLRLVGDPSAIMGKPVSGKQVFKVGFSGDPTVRCRDHNRALPECAFKWHVFKSTADEGLRPYASSGPALAGEKAMKKLLHKGEESLGGEFFLASEASIEQAWKVGKFAAKESE